MKIHAVTVFVIAALLSASAFAQSADPAPDSTQDSQTSSSQPSTAQSKPDQNAQRPASKNANSQVY